MPDRQVTLLRAEQVVATVPEAVAALDLTRPLTLISGPLATSDIKLERVEGIHGSRQPELVIVATRDSEPAEGGRGAE